MYLSRYHRTDIFVSELQTTVPLRKIFFTTIIILCQIPVLLAQQVWPGDINNNGIVNNIDVLYWAVANGATGAGRTNASTEWQGQALPATLWGTNFPNGLNFAYADCDGNGVINEADKDVITQNYGQVHGTIIPDEYPQANPANDPSLQLSSDMSVVAPEGTLLADLSLGTAADSITGFYGIAFTLRYDPDVVGNKGNDLRLDLPDTTWMSGQGDDKVIQFVQHDRTTGLADYAIVRKNGIPADGFGKIGTFSIVMEDIIVGLTKITATDIQLVNLGLESAPVAGSEYKFSVDSITATVQPIVRGGLKLYPNPVLNDAVTLEADNAAEQIQFIQLFDANGRLLQERHLSSGTGKQTLSVGKYPRGIYIVKVYTDRHLYVRSFFR